MKFSRGILSASTLTIALGLAACSSSDNNTEDPGQGPSVAEAVYQIFVADHEGNLNVYTHNIDNSVSEMPLIQPKNKQEGAVSLGEIHMAHNKLFVVINDQLTNDAGELTGGGLAVYMLHEDGTIMFEDIISMPSELMLADGTTPATTRFVHTYMDPDHKYLWLNNDGVRGDTGNDSVFRVNIDPMDTTGDTIMDDHYLQFWEIEVGNGHKKSAFSFPTDDLASKKYFVTHNSSDQSISIIDNNHMSANYMDVIAGPNSYTTFDMTSMLGTNNPHGMAFSPISGHVYTGITSGTDKAVFIIDTTTDAPSEGTHIMAGTGTNEIPGGGYLHATHDGKWVLMVGFIKDAMTPDDLTKSKGYLSVINTADDTVADFELVGPLSASSLDISEMMMDMGDGNMMKHIRVIVPGNSGGAMSSHIAMYDLNDMTGELTLAGGHIAVGEGSAHRNGVVSEDGMFAYYPNGGGCDVDPHEHSCDSFVILDVHNASVAVPMVHTAGHEPGNILVRKIGTGSVSGTPSNGGGGQHH